MNLWAVIAVTFPSMAYYFSDCYLIGEFTAKTIIPRTVIIIPFLIYVFLNSHTKDYRIMVPMGYLVGHGAMWGTIWACVYLDNLSFACVGFFIIMFVFMALSTAAPLKFAVVAQALLFVDIAIANTFLHYPDYFMMFLLGLPLYIGIVVFEFAIERTYKDQLKIEEKLEEHLQHDMLTGVYNRNIFSQITDDNKHFICGKNENIAVAMYDLDNFKHINDTYGHIAGDETLVRVTQAVKSKLHDGEYLIRWGGEEFIVILKGKNMDFKERAEQIRKEVENLTLAVGKVTISIGIVQYNGEDYQQIIDNTDKALYKAKNNGRNQVVVYSA